MDGVTALNFQDFVQTEKDDINGATWLNLISVSKSHPCSDVGNNIKDGFHDINFCSDCFGNYCYQLQSNKR